MNFSSPDLYEDLPQYYSLFSSILTSLAKNEDGFQELLKESTTTSFYLSNSISQMSSSASSLTLPPIDYYSSLNSTSTMIHIILGYHKSLFFHFFQHPSDLENKFFLVTLMKIFNFRLQFLDYLSKTDSNKIQNDLSLVKVRGGRVNIGEDSLNKYKNLSLSFFFNYLIEDKNIFEKTDTLSSKILKTQLQLCYNDYLVLSKYNQKNLTKNFQQKMKKIQSITSSLLQENKISFSFFFFYSPFFYSSLSLVNLKHKLFINENCEENFIRFEEEIKKIQDNNESEFKLDQSYIKEQIDKFNQSISSNSTSFSIQLSRLELIKTQYEENLQKLKENNGDKSEIEDLEKKIHVTKKMIEKFIQGENDDLDDMKIKNNKKREEMLEKLKNINNSIKHSPLSSTSSISSSQPFITSFSSFTDLLKDKLPYLQIPQDLYSTSTSFTKYLPDLHVLFPSLRMSFNPYYIEESIRISKSILEKYSGEKTHFSMLFSREFFTYLTEAENKKRQRQNQENNIEDNKEQRIPSENLSEEEEYQEYEKIFEQNKKDLFTIDKFLPDYPYLIKIGTSSNIDGTNPEEAEEAIKLIQEDINGTISYKSSSSIPASFIHFRLNNYNKILNNFYNTKNNKLKDFLEEELRRERIIKDKEVPNDNSFLILIRLYCLLFFDLLLIFLLFELKFFDSKQFLKEYQSEKKQMMVKLLKPDDFEIEKTKKVISLLNKERLHLFSIISIKIEKYFLFKPNNFVNSRFNNFMKKKFGGK